MRREFGCITEVERGKRYRVSWTEDGVKKTHRVRGTRRDASDYLAKVQTGIEGAAKDITYAEYWRTVVEPSLSQLAPKTQSEYRYAWRFLCPAIGAHRVADTNYRAVQATIDKVEAPSTQQKCKALWSKICTMAMLQDGLLSANPVAGVRIKPAARREKRLWDASEAKAALAAMRGTSYEPLVLLSLSCGLRPEEVFALDWEDLSFDGGYCAVGVSRTVVTVDGKAVEQQRTKTAGSTRTSVCGGVFAARLEELSRGKSGALRPNGHGGRTAPTTVTRNWKKWCERNGVEYVSFENLRSNYKTLAAQAMIPAELARMQMGHAGVGVAEQHYLVANMQLLRLAADMFCELFSTT